MEVESDVLVNVPLQVLQRTNICFEVTLTATSVPTLNKYSRLELPAWFVREHGDKIRSSVKLHSKATGRAWTVQLVVRHPHKSPQVQIYNGWSAFASSNGLVEGDRLAFTLTAMSEFEVCVSHIAGTAFPCAQAPRIRLKRRKASQRLTDAEPGGSKIEDVTADICADRLLEKQQELVTSFNRRGSPWNLSRRIGNHGHEHRDNAPSKKLQNSLPSFSKHLKRHDHYRLEVPGEFVEAFGSRIHTHVKLQGICEGFPLRTVACARREDRGRRRVDLTEGWKEFKTENSLEVGQEIVFTLTADSSFVVRPRVQQ